LFKAVLHKLVEGFFALYLKILHCLNSNILCLAPSVCRQLFWIFKYLEGSVVIQCRWERGFLFYFSRKLYRNLL